MISVPCIAQNEVLQLAKNVLQTKSSKLITLKKYLRSAGEMLRPLINLNHMNQLFTFT